MPSIDREALTPLHVVAGLIGDGARVWTSDLSHDYVRINAEYRS